MNPYQTERFARAEVINSRTGDMSRVFIARVFAWMFVALGVSALFAFVAASNPQVLSYMFSETTGKMNILGWLVMLAPLGFVILMSFGFERLSAPAITGLFMLYAAVNGISLSFILLAFTAKSLIGCFVSSAAMFGVMAVMGYTTKQDLTSFGRIMIMGLVGILIASLINLFLHNGTMDYIISFIGVLVFTGLTAYDVQKLKQIGAGVSFEGGATATVSKLAIIGALNLYLDFINIFIFMLRLFGGRRD